MTQSSKAARSSRRWYSGSVIAIGICLLLLFGGLALNGRNGADAAPPADVFNGVSQSALQKCMAANTGNCADSVPGLAKCMEARLHCNASVPDLSFKNSPAGQGAGNAVAFTQVDAVELALSGAKNPADPANRVAVKQLTIAELKDKGQLVNLDIPGNLQTWVVTVHGKTSTFGSPAQPAQEGSMYTTIINAVTGAPIDNCIGDGCFSVG